MDEKRDFFMKGIRGWAKKEGRKAEETIAVSMAGLPKEDIDRLTDVNNRNPNRYGYRAMNEKDQIVKNSKGKYEFVFPEKIYALEGENQFEGIAKRVFTRKKINNDIPDNLNDKTLKKINSETGYKLSRFELMLLSGYIFEDKGSEHFFEKIINRRKQTTIVTCCIPAVDYIDRDISYKWRFPRGDWSVNLEIENYKFTDSDGKELSHEEVKALVGKVMAEMEKTQTIGATQGDQR